MTEERARILIIDDDPDFVQATKKVLESKPYEVLVAYDGKEGLQKTREEQPDLILLDIIMPLTDGFTVCEEIKGNPEFADIPVLMLTSFSQRVGETTLSVSRGFSLEAEDYIDKPVKPPELLARVEKQLRKKKK
jgi:DNA-binding response OmpR family regulator